MITVQGNLESYCDKCPFLELEEFAVRLDGVKIYTCANRALCANLYNFIQQREIVHCKDCKYKVVTKDGEYPPHDIVCAYHSSDGFDETDYCSYGRKGEYNDD
jgi:DNA-directed RNA polymerase subunit RPC12/RpoP